MSEQRRCGYCGVLFEPTAAEQRFCKRGHKEKAKTRRSQGFPERKPGVFMSCGWCCSDLTDEDDAYCCADHRTQHLRCQRKESFYTAEAAQAMAEHRLVSVSAQGSDLWFYHCPGPGESHWHLFDRAKQRAKRRVA